jgi:hypothetical protein
VPANVCFYRKADAEVCALKVRELAEVDGRARFAYDVDSHEQAVAGCF